MTILQGLKNKLMLMLPDMPKVCSMIQAQLIQFTDRQSG